MMHTPGIQVPAITDIPDWVDGEKSRLRTQRREGVLGGDSVGWLVIKHEDSNYIHDTHTWNLNAFNRYPWLGWRKIVRGAVAE